ncbi:MAG: hypothetical protein A2Y10_09855 [Planctomycetes bacterium GWF2_41_51]|nr:MAG: hypothetical protein A2Y10_09855 [Planctomycetes bacterium GWF2_41_51]HBG25462.1 hypothetical protein [Phycisphaerales bacterium]
MKRRERILTALSIGVPDRPPISFGVGPNAEDTNVGEVYRYFGARDKNDLYAVAGIDGFNVWAWNAVMGRYAGESKKTSDGTALDFWGNYDQKFFGLGDCDTVKKLEKHNWPDIKDFDFSHIYEKAKEIRAKDMAVAAGHLGVGFQMHVMLRGYERAFFDLAEEKYVQCLVERVSEFTASYIEELLKAGNGLIDVVRADEDMGNMDRMLLNPNLWRRLYKTAWQRVFQVVHKYGAKIWFHSCGCIMPVLDDLIETGIDCWNPFPPNVAGNEHLSLKSWRKGKIALDGGVSHPVLVSGTPDDVKRETQKVLDTFAPDGGLLIGPAQVFTSDIPPENIISFFKTALSYKG